MGLIAKMNVTEVQQFGHSGSQIHETIKLDCVYSDDKEHPNWQWSQYTPSGHLELMITNPEAFGKLKAGDEVHVEIRKVRG